MTRALILAAIAIACVAITYLALFRSDPKDRP